MCVSHKSVPITMQDDWCGAKTLGAMGSSVLVLEDCWGGGVFFPFLPPSHTISRVLFVLFFQRETTIIIPVTV